MMWRGIYVSKLPGLERKVRVLFNWTFEMFFPRDIVQTIDLRSEDPSSTPAELRGTWESPAPSTGPGLSSLGSWGHQGGSWAPP